MKEKNDTFAVLSDYHVTTNTKATVLDIWRKNFSQNLLRFFYYNLSCTSPWTYCVLLQARLVRRPFRGCLGFRGGAASLERSGYQFDSDAVKGGESERAGEKTRDRRQDGGEGLRRHSISLFSRMEGGTHPSVRSCHSPRVMVAEWVAGAGQTSHNLLLLLLLSFLHSFPGCL